MNENITFKGNLEISPDGRFAFVRSGNEQFPYEAKDENDNVHVWQAAPDDVYVSEQQLKDINFKTGDIVECTTRDKTGNERFSSAVDILSINKKP